MKKLLAIAISVLFVAAACGNDDADTSADDDGSSTTSTTEADDTTTTEADDTTTTTEASTTTTTTATTTTGGGGGGGLPGEPIDIFPYEGDVLAVVGVEADDILNVRAGPGVAFDVVFTLEPLHIGATATGNNRTLNGSFWSELTFEGQTGWANGSFLLQPGGVDDATAELYPNPADLPSAETLLDLAAIVAAEVASVDPRSEITIVDGPTVGDLGEITVDVIGLGDDSVGGFRLHLFATEGPDTFTLKTVERRTLCMRGTSGELCV